MIGFEIVIDNITAEQNAKLKNWASSRTRDYVIIPTAFIGILKETADQQRFIETMRRNFRNWGIQHIKYKRDWIKPITVAKYFAYGCSDRLLARARDVIKQTKIAFDSEKQRRYILRNCFNMIAQTIKQRHLHEEKVDAEERAAKKRKMHEDMYSKIEPSPQERDQVWTENMEREMAFGK